MYTIFKILLLYTVIIGLMFIGGVFGILSPAYGWGIFSFAVISIMLFLRRKKLSLAIFYNNNTWFERLLWSFVLIFFLSSFIRTFAPVMGSDALSCHLDIPKHYINYGGFKDLIQHFPFACMQLGTQMLFMLVMLIGPSFLAQTVTFFISLLLFYAIYKFGQIYFNNQTGLLAATLVTATSVFHMESFYVQTDLSLALFLFAAFWALWDYTVKARFKYLILFGIFSGTALSIKLNGAIFIGLLFLYLLAVIVNDKRFYIRKKILYLLAPLSLCLLIYLPWILRTYYYTGNPFYPFFNKFFILRDSYVHLQFIGALYKPAAHPFFTIIPKTVFGYFYYPFLISFKQIVTPDNFIGPLFLSLFIVAVCRRFWHLRILKILAFFAWISYSLYFLGVPQLRHIYIVICLISFICSWGLYDLLKKKARLVNSVLCIAIICYLFLFLGKSVYEKAKAYPAAFGIQSEDEFNVTYEHGFRLFRDCRFLNDSIGADEKILAFTPLTYHLNRDFVLAYVLQMRLADTEYLKSPNDFLNYLINNGIYYVWFDADDDRSNITACLKIMNLVEELIKTNKLTCVYNNKQENSYVYRVNLVKR